MTHAEVFDILAPPQWRVPMVFNSPHSGSHLPDHFLAQTKLDARQLRTSEDSFVDQLFSGCTNHGVPLLRSLVSRSYIDLNREPYELDPRMFVEDLPGTCNPGSPRVASGLGTIPRIVGDGLEIYRGRICLSDALARVETVYRPYHQALSALLDEAHRNTGFVLLVDCHSMPSGTGTAGPDCVVGDRFGSSCACDIADCVERFLRQEGLAVQRNRPYAGGFFTQTHGAPFLGRHALQIEVCRSLYMNEATRQPHGGFHELQAMLQRLTGALAHMVMERLEGSIRAEAAE